MQRYIYIIMCVALLTGVSCSSEKKGGKKAVTAKVQSAPYELLVVADKEWLKTGAGQTLVEVVEAPIEGLPQAEANFRVTYINPYAWSGTFKTYANIVVAEVGKKHPKGVMGVQTDVYACPQVVIRVCAPDDITFVELMKVRGSQLLERLNENEFFRERGLLAKIHSGVVATQAQKLFGVDFHVPKDIDDIKKGRNFLWAAASKQEFRMNVCLYVLPWQEMTTERFVEVRDSVMKVNIPGGREDQWMETDSRTVTANMVKVRDSEVLVVRGLWDMRNDAMGGPFVSYVYPDSVHHRLLVAEGFVFAPEEKKRPIVRRLEAALQTVVF